MMDRRDFMIGAGALATGSLVLPSVAQAFPARVPRMWLVLDASAGHDHRVVVEPVDVHYEGIVRRGTVGRVWAMKEPATTLDELRLYTRELQRGRGGQQTIVWDGLDRDVFSHRELDELQVLFAVEFPPTVVTEGYVAQVAVVFTGVEVLESEDRLEFVAHPKEFGGYEKGQIGV